MPQRQSARAPPLRTRESASFRNVRRKQEDKRGGGGGGWQQKTPYNSKREGRFLYTLRKVKGKGRVRREIDDERVVRLDLVIRIASMMSRTRDAARTCKRDFLSVLLPTRSNGAPTDNNATTPASRFPHVRAPSLAFPPAHFFFFFFCGMNTGLARRRCVGGAVGARARQGGPRAYLLLVTDVHSQVLGAQVRRSEN